MNWQEMDIQPLTAMSEELIPPPERAKRAVIDNIRSSEETRGISEIQSRMMHNLIPSDELQKQTWIVFSGITGATKSSTIGSYLYDSETQYQLALQTPDTAPIYTWNVAWAIQAAERVWGKEMQFGAIDDQKYEYVGEIHRRVRAMVETYMPINIAILDEEVTETELLDQGPQRANLTDLKRLASHMDVSIIYVQTDEKTRHENVLQKEKLRDLGVSPKLKDEQEAIGIVGDNRSLEEVHESYVKTGNQKMERQHLNGVAFVLQQLAQQGRLQDTPRIANINRRFGTKTIQEIRQVFTDYEIMNLMHEQGQLLVAQDILGPSLAIPEHNITHVGIAKNTRRAKSFFKRDENKALVAERNILLALKKRAEEEQNLLKKGKMIIDLEGVGVFLEDAA